MPCFAEAQAAFAAALVDPDAPVPQGIFADPTDQRRERLGVYRNTVVSGLVEQLSASFPVVQRLVGADFFRSMARAYVLEHPPRSPVLMHYGDDFPGFVGRFPPALGLPYLSDVAGLEAMRIRAYHAADERPLSSETARRLFGIRPDALKRHPSAVLLRSRFPVLTIWLANQPDTTPTRIRMAGGETVLIVRPQMTVNVHLIDARTANLFEAIGRPTSDLADPPGDTCAIGLLAELGVLVERNREQNQ